MDSRGLFSSRIARRRSIAMASRRSPSTRSRTAGAVTRWRAVAAVKAAGYRNAMTVAPGLASARHRFELRHIPAADDMRIQGLAAQLEALGAR